MILDQQRQKTLVINSNKKNEKNAGEWSFTSAKDWIEDNTL